MSKRDTDRPDATYGKSPVDPTPRDPASVRAVLDFDFASPLPLCGNCQRTIEGDEPFRTVAPSPIRYHSTCLSTRVVGSNAADDAHGQHRFDQYGRPIRC